MHRDTKQHLQEPNLHSLHFIKCCLASWCIPCFATIAKYGLHQCIKELSFQDRAMYAQLLTTTIKPKHCPPGCFAQKLNGRAEPSCAMHQDAQILELINLLNGIPLIQKSRCCTLAMLEYQRLCLFDIDRQSTGSTESSQNVELLLEARHRVGEEGNVICKEQNGQDKFCNTRCINLMAGFQEGLKLVKLQAK